jgi:GMP synthase (glutamine-hydrolysing)
MPSTRPLHIVVTGEPLPVTRELRGDFSHLIREATGDVWRGAWQASDARLADELPRPTDVAGLIITGSAASVTSREPWMLRLEAYLRDAVARGTPTLGICFGHQLLAQALGGRVVKSPAGREIGTVRVELVESDGLLGDAGRSFPANMTHLDAVVDLPPGARVLARTALDPNAALGFSERVYGVQFHPEVDGEVMLHYVNAREQFLIDEGLDGPGIRREVRDTPESAAILRRFASLL